MVGRPGKFVAVQVKCTIAKLESGKGYICSVCSSHKAYPAGSFDFVAAYVILEDAWYIIPEKEIRGLKSISLCTVGAEAKYEQYREAWSLLKKASEIGEGEGSVEPGGCAGAGGGCAFERGGTDADGGELFPAIHGTSERRTDEGRRRELGTARPATQSRRQFLCRGGRIRPPFSLRRHRVTEKE